jgi:hypothetical protein
MTIIGSTPLSGSAADASHGGPLRLVTLSMTADKDCLALARTSATHVGGLLGLPTLRICDLRLAVDEACACFLDTLDAAGRRWPDAAGSGGSPGAGAVPETMELAYDRRPGELRVTVRAAVGESWPVVDALGWEVLRAVVGDVRFRVQDDGLGVLTLIQPLSAWEA